MTKLLLLSIALAGCTSSVTATPVHPSPRPMIAHASGPIEVLYRAPTRPHVDVSELLVAYSGDYVAETRSLVERAEEIGCDGVVVGATRETAEGRRVMASCIVYTDHDEVSASRSMPRR